MKKQNDKKKQAATDVKSKTTQWRNCKDQNGNDACSVAFLCLCNATHILIWRVWLLLCWWTDFFVALISCLFHHRKKWDRCKTCVLCCECVCFAATIFNFPRANTRSARNMLGCYIYVGRAFRIALYVHWMYFGKSFGCTLHQRQH